MAFVEGGSLVFPKQRLSYKEKMEDDCIWGKRMIDLLILNYSKESSYINKKDITEQDRMLSNYRLYNNQISQADFERECNPLGLDVGQMSDEIKPYNKTPNKINVLLGEEYKRPFNYKTVLVNSEGIKSKQLEKSKILSSIVNNYVQKIVSSVIPDMEITEEAPVELQHLEEYMRYNYQDSRERTANQLLQYLVKKESIVDKKNDGFKHALLSGLEAVWVGVENDEPTVSVLNSLGVFYHKSPDVKFIQDGLFAGYKTRMTTGDIIDVLGEYLNEEDLSRLERTMNGVSGTDAQITKDMQYHYDDVSDYYLRNSLLQNAYTEGAYSRPGAEDWTVVHVEWKSQKRVGFLKSINEYGDEQLTLVSEDFKVPTYAQKVVYKEYFNKNKVKYVFDGMELEWSWIPEVWEGIRIGQDIYCCIGPKKYQFRSLDNPHDVKLGYHGLVYSAMNADPISLMDRMKPFQFLFFIVVHKFKKLIAKDKGQVFHFDLSMVPENIGLEKTLYYLEEMDIDFYNPLANSENQGAYQRGKITSATSRSNMQHILNYVSLMAALDEQINDTAGVTRQREGQTAPNQAVTNAQQDILMSSTITEAAYFRPHDLLWESILNSLIQVAQSCWRDKSVIKQYVLDDLSVQTLEISPDALINADLGVFISNSTRDNDVFAELRSLTQPLLQNDKAKFSDIIKLLKSTSIKELETNIVKSEEKAFNEQMEQIRAQQEAQIKSQEMAVKMKEMDQKFQKELQAQKDIAALERELVDAMGYAKDNDINDNQVPDVLEYQKFLEDLKFKYSQLKHDKEENEKDRESQEKIAKLKKANNQSPTKK